ncbi:MAG: hypothetical protein HLUCCX10_00220 [Algoriphagus marincola HL-49]|uniref:O-methyltransferase C-terminal domain-containing protein n=1 Tax=Algoriphagus marincola HL-49 TaxID=1305737 RepID=A0A0P7YFT6_9BACT|nr:MAG: hypothetical protein HLUCCX10_00220 [Algoriphagus marincola HL-49]
MHLGIGFNQLNPLILEPMKDQYRFISSTYQALTSLVFGQKLKRANAMHFSKIPNKAVLIIGGGDGSNFKPIEAELEGEYWELSPSMLSKAIKNLRQSNLSFHLGHFNSLSEFDLIFLPFVLDTMGDQEMLKFLEKVKKNVRSDGLLILSDFFFPSTYYQKMITWMMIRFFQLFASHSRGDLPDLERLLSKAGFCLMEEKKWEGGWIRSQIWRLN